MPDDREIAGPILSLVGGVAILFLGGVQLYVGESTNFVWLAGQGFVGALFGVIIIIVAIDGFLYRESQRALGVVAIALAFVTLVSSIGVGFLLVALGGTCLIVFGPKKTVVEEGALTEAATYDGRTIQPLEPPRPPEAKPVGALRGRAHRLCPSCGFANPTQATLCPRCGTALPL